MGKELAELKIVYRLNDRDRNELWTSVASYRVENRFVDVVCNFRTNQDTPWRYFMYGDWVVVVTVQGVGNAFWHFPSLRTSADGNLSCEVLVGTYSFWPPKATSTCRNGVFRALVSWWREPRAVRSFEACWSEPQVVSTSSNSCALCDRHWVVIVVKSGMENKQN
jgi:hypothetical protein